MRYKKTINAKQLNIGSSYISAPIALYDHTLYVPDSINNCIHVIDIEQKTLLKQIELPLEKQRLRLRENPKTGKLEGASESLEVIVGTQLTMVKHNSKITGCVQIDSKLYVSNRTNPGSIIFLEDCSQTPFGRPMLCITAYQGEVWGIDLEGYLVHGKEFKQQSKTQFINPKALQLSATDDFLVVLTDGRLEFYDPDGIFKKTLLSTPPPQFITGYKETLHASRHHGIDRYVGFSKETFEDTRLDSPGPIAVTDEHIVAVSGHIPNDIELKFIVYENGC